MIEKIIHYCWFGGNPIDEKSRGCIESWKKFCPEYKIIEWNEKNFDINSNLYVKQAYDAKKWAFITDYVRLYVLYNYGGIYMDTDVELLKNLDDYLDNDAFSGFESEEIIPTGIMASEKHGEWVKYLLTYYDGRSFIKDDGSLDMTPNIAAITKMTKERYNINLNNTYQKIAGVVTLYPKDYFCPKSHVTGEINITENTVCIHHFNGSWISDKEKKRAKRIQRYSELYGSDIDNQTQSCFGKCARVCHWFYAFGLNGIIAKLKADN